MRELQTLQCRACEGGSQGEAMGHPEATVRLGVVSEIRGLSLVRKIRPSWTGEQCT